MRYRVLRVADLDSDALEIAEYIAHDSPAAAARFLAQVGVTLSNLATMPHLGRVANIPVSGGSIRSVPIAGFRRYLVYYRVVGRTVEAYAIAYGGRETPPRAPGS